MVSITINTSLDGHFDKSKNYYCRRGGETRSGSRAAMLKVAREEVSEKALLPRILEPCSISPIPYYLLGLSPQALLNGFLASQVLEVR